MRSEPQQMDVPAGTGAGAALIVDRFTDKTVLVGGTFTATLRVQGSVDGSTWADLTADISTPSAHQIPHTVRLLRVNVSAFTSAPSVWFNGFDGRSV
jgi:hypothetical protein